MWRLFNRIITRPLLCTTGIVSMTNRDEWEKVLQTDLDQMSMAEIKALAAKTSDAGKVFVLDKFLKVYANDPNPKIKQLLREIIESSPEPEEVAGACLTKYADIANKIMTPMKWNTIVTNKPKNEQELMDKAQILLSYNVDMNKRYQLVQKGYVNPSSPKDRACWIMCDDDGFCLNYSGNPLCQYLKELELNKRFE